MTTAACDRIRIVACFVTGIMMSQPGCQTNAERGMRSAESPASGFRAPSSKFCIERQITHGRGGRILTNTGVWSPDGEWILYDTRSDAAGDSFDGELIEMVNVRTREVRQLYRARDGAHCGVAAFHPRENKVVFILGPEAPTPDWQYGPFHRQGVIVDAKSTGDRSSALNLDARDLTPPFTPGALHGGSHVHVWDASG